MDWKTARSGGDVIEIEVTETHRYIRKIRVSKETCDDISREILGYPPIGTSKEEEIAKWCKRKGEETFRQDTIEITQYDVLEEE